MAKKKATKIFRFKKKNQQESSSLLHPENIVIKKDSLPIIFQLGMDSQFDEQIDLLKGQLSSSNDDKDKQSISARIMQISAYLFKWRSHKDYKG